ncbi:MAG: hypothetical protein U1F42_09895 [Candidatus Competibacteraceae bacterium]
MAFRVFWYAPGGGLGHATRALAILRHLRPCVPEAEIVLALTTPYIQGAILQGLTVLRLPSAFEWQAAGGAEQAAALVRALFTALGPFDLLVVDTFADGLQGELTPEVLELARRRVLIYRIGGVDPETSPAWPLYHRILAPYPETPHPAAEAVGIVLIRQPEEALSRTDARRRLGLDPEAPEPVILGLHAGDPGEVSSFFELIRAACETLPSPWWLRLLTPLPTTENYGAEHAHLYPAAEVLPAADLVLTGAGYNSHAELSAFGLRGLYCPFMRSHDSQWTRLLPEQPRFELTLEPAALTALMQNALRQPPPPPLPPEWCDGARRAAACLVEFLK